MIRFLVLLLVVVTLGAGGAWVLQGDTGYVLVRFMGWSLETSAVGLLLLVLAAGLAIVYGGRMLVGLLRLPGGIRRALAAHRSRRAHAAFVAGLRRLLSGEWERAEVELARRAADHEAPELNWLCAAIAAHRAGQRERRDHYLALAATEAPAPGTAVALVRAALLRDDGQPAEAARLLAAARERDRRSRALCALLAECLADSGQWQALMELLAEPTARRALPAQRLRALKEAAVLGRLREARDSGRLELVREVYERADEDLRQQPAVRRAYLHALAGLNAERMAAERIARVLDREYDADLLRLYGRLEAQDPVVQLANVEQWLKRYGERPEMLLVAGQICLRNRLWGKARSYLDAVMRLAPDPEACLALARLAEQSGHPEQARDWYRQGLELATRR